MHDEHEYIPDVEGEHTHSHTHTHTHEHTHDGTTHTHEHTHEHIHTHEHPHDHDHLHEEGSVHNHTHSHTPMEQLTALMKYMADHNAAHTRELADLASQLEQAGNHNAYEKVMAAVADYEKGNTCLSDVLKELETK